MTVYIDSLFLTNFFMDSIILLITSIMRRKQPTLLKLFLGGTVSAVYGTLIFFPDLAFLYGAVLRVVFSAIPVIICCSDRTLKGFIFSLSCFWFITATTGGIILMISNFTNFGDVMQTMISNCVFYIRLNPFIMMGGCALLYILAEVYRRSCIKNFTADRIILDISVEYMGKSYGFYGLIDTGCELTEPLSGAPVIVAESYAFKKEYTSDTFIEINTVSGGGRLELIFPDKIYVKNSDYFVLPDTVIALTERKLSENNIYNALINPSALECGKNINNKSFAEVS